MTRAAARESSTGPTRAAVWWGDRFEIELVDKPTLGAEELLVAVELATVCGSDVHTVEGRRSTPVPTVLGHEAVGHVVAAGRGATAEVGDRVVWTIGTACDTCRPCSRGLAQKCERVRKYGHAAMSDGWRLNGALADHVHLVAGTGLVRVPDDLPAALLAPASCATATVAAAARRVALEADDAVVVIGCGMLGLTAVAYARHLGATSIVACDVDETRRESALHLGATAVCAPEQLAEVAARNGADVVMEMSGHPDAVASSVAIAAIGGRVALVGSVSPGPAVSIDPESVVRRLVSVVGSHNYVHRDLVTAVDFLATTTAADALAGLVAQPLPLVAIATAFAHAEARVAPRVSVQPSG